MRSSLDRDAALAYLDCTRWSFFGGLISWSQCLDRLAAFVSLCEQDSDARRYAKRVLRMEDYTAQTDWPLGEPPTAEGSDSPSALLPGADDSDQLLYLVPPSSTGLSDWEFHRYDADFFPAVPHGHGRDKPQKLDPYLGWVYRGSVQLSREPRRNIVALWNEAAFRDLALASIRYFIEHHSTYSGWRVPNPLRLPRRR